MASIPCPGECGERLHFDITSIKFDPSDHVHLKIVPRGNELEEHAIRCADWMLKFWSGEWPRRD